MKFPRSSIGLDGNILTSVSPTALWYVRSMLCTNAGHRLWVDTKINVITVVVNATAITVAVTGIVLNARQTNRHFGSKTG